VCEFCPVLCLADVGVASRRQTRSRLQCTLEPTTQWDNRHTEFDLMCCVVPLCRGSGLLTS
jgi:hypothetical protein